MEQIEKPIIEASGEIHIGETFTRSFQASWPFGKIEIYQNNIILRVQYIPNFVLQFFQLMGKFSGIMKSYKNISNHPRGSYFRRGVVVFPTGLSY